MEKKPLLPKPKEGESLLNIRNLVMGNIVAVLYHVASAFHAPTLDQYLYKRLSLEVFGNYSGDSVSPANVTCYSNKTSEGYILQEMAQKATTSQQMYFSLVNTAAALVGSLVLGSYSDYFGRKVVFILPAIGDMVRSAMLTAIIHWELDLNWYYIGEFLCGLGSTNSGILLASYAYAADNTPPRKSRTLAIAVIDTTSSIAYAGTSAATGYFIQDMGYFYPSLVSALIMWVLILVVVFFIRESKHSLKKTNKSKVNLTQGIRNVVGLYLFDNTCRVRSLFWLGLMCYFFSQISANAVININTLFMMNLPFCWTPERIGYFTMASTMAKQLLGVPLIKLLHYCIGDEVIGVFSAFTFIVADLLHGLATTDWMMYGYAMAGALSFAAVPVIRAIMSRMAPKDSQGSLFTSLTLADKVGGLMFIPSFAYIYEATVNFMRGFIFLVFAGTHVVAFMLLILFACLTYKHNRRIEHDDTVTIQDTEWRQPTSQSNLAQSTEM
ncbi:lysosomal proton-coupled steroid conjugate and bile acid symporter SLC46A3-like [Haliotis cracherodii]|uniref:lysosomal proton-coupled steroid conjugate and bile acid symporter SLC46A3-like n=1 Tax=Haliotis cracherodii TaxID=6455 RepID=UPI0039E8C1EF